MPAMKDPTILGHYAELEAADIISDNKILSRQP
jgi:hypothetical protein